jgi:hypothetical protein
MLKRLLSIVARQGTITPREVSMELHISEDMVSQLFFELTRRGYLESVGKECASPCGKCASLDACIQMKAPVLWRITQKGELAARTGEFSADQRER